MSKHRLHDWYDALRERIGGRESDELLPPRWLIEGIGGGDFKVIGNEFLRHFTQKGGLKPGDRVLDVGCGCGRMAVALVPYLTGTGEYCGFDIVPKAVAWCQKRITPRYPRFHFDLANIYNKAYNPRGKCKSVEYRFPYQDNSFDFAFLTSVFTHMLAADMEHYLSEIARTLKAGGRCMINFFLLNKESRQLMAQKKDVMQFRHEMDHCKIEQIEVPEAAVAYDEDYMRKCFARKGLKIVDPVHYGNWCGREIFLSYQDIVLAVKNNV